MSLETVQWLFAYFEDWKHYVFLGLLCYLLGGK